MAECRNDSRRNVNAANEHIFEQIVCRTVSQSKRRSGNSLKAAAKNNENVNAAPTICEFAAFRQQTMHVINWSTKATK